MTEDLTCSEVDITRLLPQQPPFVMVDRLIHCDPVVTESELLVKADNLFVEDGALSEYGMIENVAQTCAARVGYLGFLRNLPVMLGYIGAIRDMKIEGRPKVGELIRTAITVSSEVFNMILVDAEMKSGEKQLLKATMKIALSDIQAQ